MPDDATLIEFLDDDLRALADRTGGPDGSRRLAWTPDWLEARTVLRESLTGLPVEVDLDEAGNLWVVLRGERPDTLVVGSHLDSVPKGGWLDGALGVMAGLELIRALAAEGTPPVTVALVDWADEEGARFSRSLFGSAACMGTLDVEVMPPPPPPPAPDPQFAQPEFSRDQRAAGHERDEAHPRDPEHQLHGAEREEQEAHGEHRAKASLREPLVPRAQPGRQPLLHPLPAHVAGEGEGHAAGQDGARPRGEQRHPRRPHERRHHDEHVRGHAERLQQRKRGHEREQAPHARVAQPRLALLHVDVEHDERDDEGHVDEAEEQARARGPGHPRTVAGRGRRAHAR